MTANSDNRRYFFLEDSTSDRVEYSLISSWIPKGSKVIDLGSGDGSLLALLKKKGVKGQGVELAKSGVKATQKKGIKAVVGKIDEVLPYKDGSFDYAICNVGIQMVMYPEILLSEMKRIAKNQIISFPNFAFWKNRADLLFKGRMPKVMIPGYDWHSTGHIHQLSIKDFLNLSDKLDLAPVDQRHLIPSKIRILVKLFLSRFPNLFANEAIFLMAEKKK